MWYEALPSLLLTGIFVCLPYGIIPVAHKLLNNGNAYSRLQNSTHQRHLVRRDTRLTGNPYVLKVILESTITSFLKMYLNYLSPRVWKVSLIRLMTIELSVCYQLP
uniref:Complex I-MWFE n=1 Tax=Daphnia galeata TaxID=27404 RepID=A0A8J2RVE4_9CRUS|nr:unnamed protein product [Daphnia galeata]